MACLYRKKNSPFWYMEWRDPKTGKIRNTSTKYRRDSVEHTRRARKLCADRLSDELDAPAGTGEGWRWVNDWMRLTFAAKTLTRYSEAWAAFSVFMAQKRIVAPRQIEREFAAEYIAFRTNPPAESGVRRAVKNTALLDLKVISRIMREAVARRLAPANPFLQLGFKRDAVRSRADILPHEMVIIDKALRHLDDDAMQVSWRIAMLYARRISETCLPLIDIDLRQETITFRNKGGKAKTKLLHPEMKPLVRKWRKEGRTHTFVMPPNFSKRWSKFFDSIGLPHITFHSARVRVATALMEAGVDQRIAMDYIDHSSDLVHRIYLRARPSHHQSAVDALGSKRSSGTSAPSSKRGSDGKS